MCGTLASYCGKCGLDIVVEVLIGRDDRVMARVARMVSLQVVKLYISLLKSYRFCRPWTSVRLYIATS